MDDAVPITLEDVAEGEEICFEEKGEHLHGMLKQVNQFGIIFLKETIPKIRGYRP